MLIHRDTEKLPSFTNAVITVGTFDGVHSGHVKIIEQLKKEATGINGETVIITFDPHPRMVINSASAPVLLLNTLEEKLELLRKRGIDHVVVVPFTIAFSEQSAERYIGDFLVRTFNPHTIIIGYDHQFGKGRKGNYTLLEEFASTYNYLVKEIPEQVLNEVAVSSTRIRKALLSGDVDTANRFLGYPFFFEGEVVKGDGIGRELGYPTANLDIPDHNKLIPADGVYAVKITFKKQSFDGMLSIGNRPTLENSRRIIEVNIFDLDADLYSNTLRIHIFAFLRAQIKYANLEELKQQIGRDEILAREKLIKDIL